MGDPGKPNEELLGRLRGWIDHGVPQGPYSLQLSPTMACDLNCVFCRRQDQLPAYYKENREIPNCRYLEIVREALALGVRVVILKGGGEPLLRKSLVLELGPLVKSHGAYANLVTNGTHLDQDLCRMFVDCGWDQVTISLDGPDAETHDTLRAKEGTFDRILNSIRRLNAAKRERGSELPLLGFHCVLTSSNFDKLGAMIGLARAHGARHIELDSMSLRFKSARRLLMNDEKTRAFLKLLPSYIEDLERHGISHNFNRFASSGYVRREEEEGRALYASTPQRGASPVSSRVPCYYPWTQAALTPSGSIVPCCYAEETYRSKADLHQVSFTEAWLRRDPEEYREAMVRGTMMPFCKDCTAMYADNNQRIRQWLSQDAESRRPQQ